MTLIDKTEIIGNLNLLIICRMLLTSTAGIRMTIVNGDTQYEKYTMHGNIVLLIILDNTSLLSTCNNENCTIA